MRFQQNKFDSEIGRLKQRLQESLQRNVELESEMKRFQTKDVQLSVSINYSLILENSKKNYHNVFCEYNKN